MVDIKLVGSGVDTLILNMRYSDSKGQPVKQELDETLLQELDYLQGEGRRVETVVATDWAFQSVLLFVEPHGAGKQWRWLLTSRLLNLAVSRGKFNDILHRENILSTESRPNRGQIHSGKNRRLCVLHPLMIFLKRVSLPDIRFHNLQQQCC